MGRAGGDVQCGNHSAFLTGLCYSVTLNVFYFLFKNCFSSNFVIYFLIFEYILTIFCSKPVFVLDILPRTLPASIKLGSRVSLRGGGFLSMSKKLT